LICTRTQQPVGQGGFHTGELCIGSARLRYIYDCGSTNQAHIDSAVVNYAKSIPKENGQDKPMVDVLFISHFDNDHIKGLETLFRHVTIKKAVIPYVDHYERLYLYAAASSEGGVSKEFQSYLSNAYGWLMEKEVEQIVVVGGDGDVGPPGSSDSAPNREVTSEYAQTEFLELKPNDKVRFSDPLCVDSEPVTHMYHYEQLNLHSGTGVIADWHFLIYVHPWKKKRAAFINLVKERLPEAFLDITLKSENNWLVEVLKKPSCVKIITECYDTVWKGAKQKKNATTLSLYSGPHSIAMFQNTVTRGNQGTPHQMVDAKDAPKSNAVHRAGWLLTGDAAIREKVRRKPFLAHYQHLREFVGVFMLPHHGSNANFDPELLSHFNAPIYSIAAGKTKHHPHMTVLRSASAAGYTAVTTADEASALSFSSVLKVCHAATVAEQPEGSNDLSSEGD
jgi:hypothetical protein